MKIKINTQLKGVDGLTPLTDQMEKSILSLRSVSINSLLIPMEGDKEKDKLDKYDLYKKIRDSGEEVDLQAEEIVLIKKCIQKFQPQLVMGQCYELLKV